MAYITTQNRIAREIDALASSAEGISFVHHFDYPETVSYVGNAAVVQSGQRLGKGCLYLPDTNSKVVITNSTGIFNLNSQGSYEIEAFVKFSELDGDALGYKFYDGHTFKLFSEALTWSEAKTACETLGGHLATSTSAEKNTFLTTVTTSYAWLGATDEVEEGTWLWVTGEEWSYTNWYSGEPNNAGNGTEHYLILNHVTKGKWADAADNGNSSGYICEWDRDLREDSSCILCFGDLSLSLSNDTVMLASSTFNSEGSGQIDAATLYNTWHHIMLRLNGGYIRLFLDGSLVLKDYISLQKVLAPALIELGGFVGCLDEFAFRHNAGDGSPTIPEYPYNTTIIQHGDSETGGSTQSNTVRAPVTRVAWTAENLPAGVTLSECGLLSGRPTTAGTYNASVSVSTNWGTDTKALHITVI